MGGWWVGGVGNAIIGSLQSPELCGSDLNIHIRDLKSAGKEWL